MVTLSGSAASWDSQYLTSRNSRSSLTTIPDDSGDEGDEAAGGTDFSFGWEAPSARDGEGVGPAAANSSVRATAGRLRLELKRAPPVCAASPSAQPCCSASIGESRRAHKKTSAEWRRHTDRFHCRTSHSWEEDACRPPSPLPP